MLCAKHKNPNGEQNRHGHSQFLTFCPLGKADVNQLVTVCVRACMLSFFSPVWLFVTPWTIGGQTPLSMGFSRQEYWSGLPFPTPPGDLPNPGIEPASPVSPALTGRFFTTEPPGKPQRLQKVFLKITCTYDVKWKRKKKKSCISVIVTISLRCII